MSSTSVIEGAAKEVQIEGIIASQPLFVASSDVVKLKHKMAHLNSTLIMLQRTIDSPDCSVYAKESSSVLDSVIEQMEECRALIDKIVGKEALAQQ